MKQKRIKRPTYHSEEQEEMFKFVRILIIVIIIVLVVYFCTRLFVTKDMFKEEDKYQVTTPGTIDYSKTIIGSMLSKPEEEYYVIIYNSEDLNAPYYSGFASNYARNEKALKVYTADLNNALNAKYYDKDNYNTSKDLDSLKVGDFTLIKVKNNKIEKVLTNIEDIKTELAYKENAVG